MFFLHQFYKFKVSKAAMYVGFFFYKTEMKKCSDILHLKDMKLNGVVRIAVRITGQNLLSLSDIYNFCIERLGLKKILKSLHAANYTFLSHLCQEKGYWLWSLVAPGSVTIHILRQQGPFTPHHLMGNK